MVSGYDEMETCEADSDDKNSNEEIISGKKEMVFVSGMCNEEIVSDNETGIISGTEVGMISDGKEMMLVSGSKGNEEMVSDKDQSCLISATCNEVLILDEKNKAENNETMVSSGDELVSDNESISSNELVSATISRLDDEMIIAFEDTDTCSQGNDALSPESMTSSTKLDSYQDDSQPLLPPTLTLKPFYFSRLPFKWFENQTRLAEANTARNTKRSGAPVVFSGQEMLMLNRSNCIGSIDENLKSLKEVLVKLTDRKRIAHITAICLVGELFLSEGPIIATQDAANLYCRHKGITSTVFSSAFYEIVSKHLNFVQVYINGKGYFIENRGSEVMKLLHTIERAVNSQKMINDHVKEKLQGIYSKALKYIDTPRDRQLLKGIIAHITSIQCATSIQGVQSRQGTSVALKKLVPSLDQYADIEVTSQMVRNDLTQQQQYQLTQRIVNARKHKEMIDDSDC